MVLRTTSLINHSFLLTKVCYNCFNGNMYLATKSTFNHFVDALIHYSQHFKSGISNEPTPRPFNEAPGTSSSCKVMLLSVNRLHKNNNDNDYNHKQLKLHENNNNYNFTRGSTYKKTLPQYY